MKESLAKSLLNFSKNLTDDTLISCQTEFSADRDRILNDLDKVLVWSSENNIMLHKEKFDLTIHKANPNSIESILPYFYDPYS